MSWAAILKWSLSQSDGTATSLPERSEEEKEWLRAALASMTVDEAARIRELSTALCARRVVAGVRAAVEAERELAAAKADALVELQDLVEGIDNAKDLFMLGGVGPLFDALRGTCDDDVLAAAARADGGPPLTGSAADGARDFVCAGTSDARVRAAAALVLATVFQNNPRAQAWALEAGALPVVVDAARDDADVGVRAAAMGALSALARDSRDAQVALLSRGGGIDAVLAPIRGGAAAAAPAARKLLRRALALLRHLTSEGCEPGAALASVLAHPNSLPGLVALLAPPSRGEPADVRDVRACAVAILDALALEAAPAPGVVDTADAKRRPRGLYPAECTPAPPPVRAVLAAAHEPPRIIQITGVPEGADVNVRVTPAAAAVLSARGLALAAPRALETLSVSARRAALAGADARGALARFAAEVAQLLAGSLSDPDPSDAELLAEEASRVAAVIARLS
jgi:hypothetical protein